MDAVARPRIDRQIGKMLAHHLRDPERGLDIVDGEHEGARLVGLRRAQDVEPSGVAVIDLRAEPPHEIHLLDIRVERGEGNAPGAQDARHDLPEAAEARDDDVLVAARRRLIVRRLRLRGPEDRSRR